MSYKRIHGGFRAALLVLTFVLVMFPYASVYAVEGVPRILNHQGRLMDPAGALLGGTGTDYCFKFSLYDSSVVGSGSKVWPSGSPSTMAVVVKSGVYNVGVGDTAAGGDTLDYNFQDNDSVYLNVDVATKVGATCAPGDGAESFETLSPRQRIYAAGYAINAFSLGGFLASPSASGNQIPVLSTGNLYLGGTNPFLNATSSNTLTLQGGGLASGDIQFYSSANRITSVGNATFAGQVAAAGGSFTTATSGTLTVTGNASTSNLIVSNGFTLGSVSGILKAVAGVVTAALVDLANDVSGILGITNGGTGTSTPPSLGQLLVGNAAGGYDLIATSSLGIISASNDWLFSGGFLAPTSTTGIIVAASSTIGNGTQVGGLTINGGATTTGYIAVQGTGTSTFARGIDIASGCFSVNGECMSGAGGGGSGVLVNIQVFISNDTYTPSAGATTAQVMVTGGGGGGGGADSPTADVANETVGGGGGAAGTAIAFIDLTATTSVAVFVGIGGTAGANTGGAGGLGATSSFSTFASAAGGLGGGGSAVNAACAAGSWGTAGTGGVATIGDVLVGGGAGHIGDCLAEVVFGGLGGASHWGGGGRGAQDGGNVCTAGSAGSAYGSGGGGASCEDLDTGATGGAGAGGAIVVYEYGPYTGVMGIDDGGTGTTTAPTFGQLLVGDGVGGYNLVATSTLNIAPNAAAAYSWTGLHQFANASSSVFSANRAYFGGTATTTIDAAGNVVVAGNLNANGQTTLANASTTNISAAYASSTNGFFGSLSIGSFTGILRATAGAIANALIDLTSDVAGILQIANGGTGWSNITAGTLLTGNGAGAVSTTTVGSSLQLSGGTLALNLSNANVWTGLQSFSNASSSIFSANRAYFGGTATTTIDDAGNVAVAGTLNVNGNATFSAATTTNLMVTSSSTLQDFTSRNATSSLLYISNAFRGAGLSGCASGADKLLWNSVSGQFSCGTDAGAGSGIASLGAPGQGQIGAAQTFATSSDTNVGITVSSAGDTHTFAPNWIGTLSTARGGTGWSNITAGTLLTGNGAGSVSTTTVGSSLQLSGGTLALNLSNANVWTGLQSFSNATSSLFESVTHYARTIQSTSTNALVLKTNLSSTAGLTLGSTSTPQILGIDTINNRATIGIGGGTPVLFVLDTKNTGGDPAGVDGGEYYNSNTSEFRCYSGSAWRTCGGQAASSTGDVQFKNSDGSFTATTNFNWSLASNGLTIKGNAGQTSDLFTIASSTGTAMFGISSAGVLELATTTDPTAAAGELKIYANEIAGRMMPKWAPPSGVDTAFQPALFGSNVVIFAPQSATVGTGAPFGATWLPGGTVSHPTPTAGAASQIHRTRYANVVTTQNQTLGAKVNTADGSMFWRGNSGTLGGFFFYTRFIVELYPANTIRLFAGLSSSNTSVVGADAITGDVIGLWHDTTDGANVLSLVTRNNTTTTKTPITGATLAAGQAFDFYIYAKPNDSTIYYRLDSVNAGTTIVDTSTSTSATLPRNTIFMGPQVQMSNGTANVTVTTSAIGIARIYVESDN